MAEITEISVYYDTDTDPYNPGYVLRYYEDGQENTVALDATTNAEARSEAASYLGVEIQSLS